MIRAIIFLGAVLAAGSAQSQVYKCVDASGKTVYSQSPCPRASKSTTLPNLSSPAPVPEAKGQAAKSAGPKTAAEMEQDFRKRRQEQDEARKKQDEGQAQAKVKEENCRTARLQLASLESGTRQSRVNDKGERYFLDEAQIAGEKDRARRIVESSCK